MGSPQIILDDLLRKQVCHWCFQHLSVPPIRILENKEIICGRCVEHLVNDSQTNILSKSTVSIFNVVAQQYQFKCTNHLNGCQDLLKFGEVKNHEFTCKFPPQHCFFCSFLGNLSAILNHCIKIHPEKVSLDGVLPLVLSDDPIKESMLLLVEKEQLLHVKFEVTEHIFRLVFELVTKNKAAGINQFAVKFFKSDEPLNAQFDYSLLTTNLINHFEKPMEQLKATFGPGAKLHCQILMGTFTLEEKELELQKRINKMQLNEMELSNQKREFNLERAAILQEQETIHSAMEVIKTMSVNLFKCSGCLQVTYSDLYFCPKVHCYCSACLTSFCKECNSVREFKPLHSIENFTVSCDWPICKARVGIKDFLVHKSGCLNRPYKCPLMDCEEVILSSDKFIEHWHCDVPKLIINDSIHMESYECMEYYLFIENDLYHLLVDFDANMIKVFIEEVNVVGNTAKFKCSGFGNGAWKLIPMTQFCGRLEVNKTNAGHQPNTNYNTYFSITALKIDF